MSFWITLCTYTLVHALSEALIFVVFVSRSETSSLHDGDPATARHQDSWRVRTRTKGLPHHQWYSSAAQERVCHQDWNFARWTQLCIQNLYPSNLNLGGISPFVSFLTLCTDCYFVNFIFKWWGEGGGAALSRLLYENKFSVKILLSRQVFMNAWNPQVIERCLVG